MFGTLKEAAIAYDLAAIKAGRPTSDLNFPDMIHLKEEPKKKKRKLVSTNTTGFNGVSKNGKKFMTYIQINGKRNYLGIFTKATSAAIAYDNAILKHGLPESKFIFSEGVPDEEDQDEDGVWL